MEECSLEYLFEISDRPFAFLVRWREGPFLFSNSLNLNIFKESESI